MQRQTWAGRLGHNRLKMLSQQRNVSAHGLLGSEIVFV